MCGCGKYVYVPRFVCLFVPRLNPNCYNQKNRPGRIIVLYDEDERIAPKAATTFIQREVDNVLMLSGGDYIHVV